MRYLYLFLLFCWTTTTSAYSVDYYFENNLQRLELERGVFHVVTESQSTCEIKVDIKDPTMYLYFFSADRHIYVELSWKNLNANYSQNYKVDYSNFHKFENNFKNIYKRTCTL